MRVFQRACLLVAIGVSLSGCAAAIVGSAPSASVCAIPVNRTIQSMYWLDCQSFASSSDPYSSRYYNPYSERRYYK